MKYVYNLNQENKNNIRKYLLSITQTKTYEIKKEKNLKKFKISSKSEIINFIENLELNTLIYEIDFYYYNHKYTKFRSDGMEIII